MRPAIAVRRAMRQMLRLYDRDPKIRAREIASDEGAINVVQELAELHRAALKRDAAKKNLPAAVKPAGEAPAAKRGRKKKKTR